MLLHSQTVKKAQRFSERDPLQKHKGLSEKYVKYSRKYQVKLSINVENDFQNIYEYHNVLLGMLLKHFNDRPTLKMLQKYAKSRKNI